MDSLAAVLLTIVVRVYPVTDADVALAAEARTVATDVLERAGVSPIWITCRSRSLESPCDPPAEADVLVRFLESSTDGPFRCGNAAGTGPTPSGLITLFTRCLNTGVDRLHVKRPVIVGYTLAHEIGHLLLRNGQPTGHRPAGLMAPELNWKRAAAGGLQFAPREVAAIHQALSGPAVSTAPADPR